MRLATGHAFTAEYQEQFHPTLPISSCTCPCDDNTLATFEHVLLHCPLYTQVRVTWMLTPQDLDGLTWPQVFNHRGHVDHLLEFIQDTRAFTNPISAR
ncbi:hypothetical protein B0F90DRAFT_1025258 [Multifurca ochricompacta]|uniref:Uncharacterized protein n=1 Tax=Multifurca ochricompacta TaxID=376703 RepID=A0AAD4QIJ8_9AGAM|nr:hypothetical protein B0F90DRAFT_1025258 [Multifurca ochricompacta]